MCLEGKLIVNPRKAFFEDLNQCRLVFVTPYLRRLATMTTLFSPLKLGALTAPNRIFMAPLTRCRADAEHVPTH
jgi:hypothetical protein